MFDRPEFSRESSSAAGEPRENSGLLSVRSIDGKGRGLMTGKRERKEVSGGGGREEVQFDTDEYVFDKANIRELCLDQTSITFVPPTLLTLFPILVLFDVRK